MSASTASRDVQVATPADALPVLRAAIIVLTVVTALSPYAGADLLTLAVSGVVSLAALSLRPVRQSASAGLPLAASGVWCLLSTLWSAAPFSTIPAALAVASVIIALLLTIRVLPNVDDLVYCIAVGFRAVLVLSIVVAVTFPSVGLVNEDYQTGALKGPFEHRNLLAFVAVVALVNAVVRRRQTTTWWFVADVVVAASCLLATQSQTGLVTLFGTLALLGSLLVVARFRGVAARLLLSSSVLLVVGYLIYSALFSFADLAGSLGRDATLTGRTDVWPAVIQAFENRPLMGYGWNGVWREGQAVTNEMWRAAGFKMFHAHDGYLEVLLEIGIVGLVLVSSVMIATLAMSIAGFLRSASTSALWPFAVTVSFAISNITEAPIKNFLGFFLIGSVYLLALHVGESGRGKVGP